MSLTTIFLRIANIFFILCYIALVVIAAKKLLLGDYLFFRTIMLVFLITQAVGHILVKDWALKTTAAILGGFNIIFIATLLPFPFEPELQPELFERLLSFFQQTMLTITALILYGLRKELQEE
ncbi:hypothetical protein [Candidatus Albibeggiatoa sp. nov. NOAA]|uniref:hypothetical protein n=1 Tax=Candidatus Albibeggiatoa sp. nov. NOAA TaxID=3162724 RepID=UPI0032F2D170|nr:hypothetical protein [Thiotrichaceae bacterium]